MLLPTSAKLDGAVEPRALWEKSFSTAGPCCPYLHVDQIDSCIISQRFFSTDISRAEFARQVKDYDLAGIV